MIAPMHLRDAVAVCGTTAWQAIGPGRRRAASRSSVSGGLPGTIGGRRLAHLRGSDGVEERGRLRAERHAAGPWPPQGGSKRIRRAPSTIALALAGAGLPSP